MKTIAFALPSHSRTASLPAPIAKASLNAMLMPLKRNCSATAACVQDSDSCSQRWKSRGSLSACANDIGGAASAANRAPAALKKGTSIEKVF